LPSGQATTQFQRYAFKRFMRNILVILSIVYSISSQASGWNDYNLEIGDGYSIFRANSFDVTLAKDMGLIISNHNFNEIGPITHYHKDSENIFIKATGWKNRGAFDGNIFKEIDDSKEFFFIVAVGSTEVKGPLDLKDFNDTQELKEMGNVGWIAPQNPNFWTPLLGTLMFISFAIMIMYIVNWFITVPVTVIVGYVLFKWLKNRHNNRLQNDAASPSA